MTAAILQTLGLVLVIEGLAYAVFPNQLKKMTEAIRDMSSEQLRFAGAAALAFGVGLVWLAKVLI